MRSKLKIMLNDQFKLITLHNSSILFKLIQYVGFLIQER